MPHQEFFFAPPEDFETTQVVLRGEEHHHLTKVLRHRHGERVTIVDGCGRAALGCKIVKIGDGFTRLQPDEIVQSLGESRLQCTLAPAVLKGSRFDWLVEKGTELGVAAFIPLLTERSEVAPGLNKIERWQRLARAAMKQCGRSVCPAVHQPMTFTEICNGVTEYNLALIADISGGPLPAFPPAIEFGTQHVLVVVGPEGGWSEVESQAARQAGMHAITLGPRRLRAETAGEIAIAKLMLHAGQL